MTFDRRALLLMLAMWLSHAPLAYCEDAADARVNAGRSLMDKGRHIEALAEFGAAAQFSPKNREITFLAGSAAHMAGKHEIALQYWTLCADDARRNTSAEWRAETHRLLALSAMQQYDAADLVADRLRELHEEGRVREAAQARSITRERMQFDSGKREAEFAEVFDGREVLEAYRMTVFDLTRPSQLVVVRHAAIEQAALPSGGRGYALVSEEGEARKVHRHWNARPTYQEARELFAKLLAEKSDSTPAKAAPAIATTTPAANQDTPPRKAPKAEPPAPRKDAEPDLPTMLTLAVRLSEVNFDLEKVTRISQSDEALAERLSNDVNTRNPDAPVAASTLIDLMARAKPDVLRLTLARCHLLKASPYRDFTLLTGLNTRAIPDEPGEKGLLLPFLDSADLFVRQSAALMLARNGERKGLDSLFKEIATGDAGACRMIDTSLRELLGEWMPRPPAPRGDTDDKVLAWKLTAADYWDSKRDKIAYRANPQKNQAYWSEPTRKK